MVKNQGKLVIDEPFSDALRLGPLAGGIQLGSFQGVGGRVLGVFHGVVHREEGQKKPGRMERRFQGPQNRNPVSGMRNSSTRVS